MTGCFKISEIANEGLTNRKYGVKIRNQIKKLIETNKKITIDMENKTGFSISFLDEVFVKLALEMGKEEFKKSINLINLNAGTKAQLNSIARRRYLS
jgi:hypothetical protein